MFVRQNKTVPNFKPENNISDRAGQAKGNFRNVSIATADWKLEITTRSVSLITCMPRITYINIKKTHSMASRI